MGEATKYMRRFEEWTTSLPADVAATLDLLADPGVAPQGRRVLTGALSYFLMQLDIIPDHEPAGAVDDAFVLRIAFGLAADHAARADPAHTALVARMTNDEEAVRAFLGDTIYAKLRRYVLDAAEKPVRGRTADQILSDERARTDFRREIEASVKRSRPLTPADDKQREALEVSIKSFFAMKLG